MKFIYLFIFVISFTNVHAQLAGTYTIDPNKSADSVNYLSIEAAIGDLNDGLRSDSATANGPGVSDTVIFLIAEGTYKTQLVLNPVTGASDTSRIFFQSASADSSKVIITYPSASSQSGNYVLKLNSASYITFSGISFQRTGSDYYATIVYVSRGRNNTFTNCHFKGSLTSKSGPDASAIYVDGDDLRNTFKNLYIDSAEYGIFYYAGSSPGSRNRIENCIIKNITKAGISLINQDSVLVKNNIISAIKDEFGSGIMMHKCFNPQLIGNKITLQNGGRGIDDYETKRKSTARGLIANNMISVTGGRWAYGMYFYQSEYMDLYNNSVYIGDKTGQQRIGLFVQDASTASRHYKVFNNIFANYSGDVGIFISQYSHSNFDSLGHNNYFSSGYYFGAIERSFTTTTYNAFTGTSNWNSQLNERNSLSTDPLYFAVDDLHTENILLNGKGKVRQIIKTDFDGELRDPLTPDIGADEYASFFTDISLLKIEKPIPGKCEDTSDLKVKLINNGSDTLRNIKLTWKINGIVQDTFSKAVSMATGSEVTYTIGRIAWPVNVYDTVQISVLDTADKNQRNNTISSAYRKGIKGDFTLGTDSSDYKTFEHALQDLYTFGVCGDVNFNLADGIYNKRLEIFPIPGAGKNSRITFRSASKDSTKVILTKPSETGNLDSNYVLSFNGADYICFENISIIRSGSNYIGQAVLFRNKAQFNILRNCVVAASKRSSVYSWIISDHGNSNDSNLIENNILKFGIGPVLFGNEPVNSNSKSYGNTFKNNTFDSSLATGVKLINQQGVQLTGNIYVSKLSGFDTAFYLKYCNNSVNISGNYINLKRGGQAIILDECTAGYYNFSSITNNMIIVGGNTGKVVYGLQLLLTRYIHINNNSIRIDTGNHIYSSALFLGINTGTPTYPGHRIFNNILINESQGFTIWASSHTNARQMIDSSDNNVFYSGLKKHILYDLANSNDIAGWNTFSGNDNKSIFLKPAFSHRDSLFTYDYRINGKGSPVSIVATDIEGDKRHSTKPDIGADEFDLLKDDAYLIGVTAPAGTPCKGFQDLKVKVRNVGTDTLKSLVIGYKIDDVFADTVSFKISLNSFKDTILNLDKVYFGDTVRWFTIYNMLPNNNPEINRGNDTLKIALRASLNGTYTIGDSSYYPTFRKAIHHLDSFGVCGPVVFQVKNGLYNERLLFNNIKGAGRTNTITFESLSGDSSLVKVESDGSYSNYDSNFVVLLDAAHDIVFSKITIARNYSYAEGGAVELRNNAARIQFLNCRLLTGRYADKFSHVILTRQDCDSIVIKNNVLKYGYNGIYFKGLSQTNRINHVIIEGNIFDSIKVINISMEHIKGLVIKQNQMLYGNMGMHLLDIDSGLSVEENEIHVKETIGININGAVFSKSVPGRIVNNMVIVEGQYNVTGIRVISCLYVDVLHNSVKIMSAANESVPLSIFSYSNSYYGHRVINNILVNTGPGHVIYFRPSTAANTIPYSDYNALYTNGKYIGRQDVINYATLADFVKAMKTDSHSINVLPVFADTFDLHVVGSNIDGKATPLTTVKTDIDNQNRSATKPDIGADEFNPIAHDIALQSIFPASDICGDTNTYFGVVIENQGGNNETNFKINLDISGVITATLDSVYKGTIIPGQVDTIYFSKHLNTLNGGTYNLSAWHSLSGDLLIANDSLKTSIKIQQRQSAPIVKDTSICGGNVLVLKPAKASGTTLQWYVSATAINPFSTADSIKINKLYKDTFLYISALPLSGCESYRKQVKVKVNQKPKYAVFSKGSIFKGAFNNGTQTEPDEICEASLSEYNLQTPTGFSDTEYGKTWQITKLEITDLTSNKIFEDTTVTWPSSAGSGTIHFLPSATGNKKSLHINIVISNLITGCDTIFERYVDVIPLPKVKWSVNTICEGDMVNFTYSSTGGVSYAWSFGDGNTSTSKNTNHKYFSAGTYMVKLKVTNSTGCTDSFSRNITVHPVPKVDFKIPATVCEGEEFVPENLTSYNGALMYNWNFGDSTISSDSSVKHAFTTPGIYKITLTATTTQSCTRSITKSITVNTKPVASFTAADSVCVGHGVFFRNFTVNAASYLWNFSSGDTFKTTNVTHTFDTAGIYSVRLISYNPNGCTDTFTKKIEVFPLPKPKFEATNICLGDSMYFINKSNTNGQTGTAYLWRFGDGKTSTLENPAHFYSKEGSFNVTLIVKESGNCTDSIVQKVTVGSKPKAAFSYIGACLDNDFVFTDFSTAATGKIISRNWDFGDGNTSSDSLTKHKFLLAGKYTVSLEVVTEFGCRNIIADTVEVFDLPFAQFTADTICAGNATIFTNNSTANTKSLWLFGDGDTSTATSPIHIYQYAGKYLVTLVVQSVKGCIDSLQQSIIILEKPTAEFSYTTSGGTVSFTSDNQNLSSYLWDFGDGDTSTSINPQHTYKANGNYTVKLVTINSSGCTDTILKQIIISNVSLRETVHPSAKIEVFPNPFKTGFNVKYELLKTSHVSIKILDLQGKEILNKDYGTQAAGSFNSYLETGFSAGTYMLQIIIDGKTETKKIIRVK